MRPIIYLLMMSLTVVPACAKKKKKHGNAPAPAASQTEAPSEEERKRQEEEQKKREQEQAEADKRKQEEEEKKNQPLGPDGKPITSPGNLAGTWVHCTPYSGGSKGYIYAFQANGTGTITRGYFSDADCREKNFQGGVHYADTVWSMSYRVGDSLTGGSYAIDRATRSTAGYDSTYYGSFKFVGDQLCFDAGFNKFMSTSFHTSSLQQRGVQMDEQTLFGRR